VREEFQRVQEKGGEVTNHVKVCRRRFCKRNPLRIVKGAEAGDMDQIIIGQDHWRGPASRGGAWKYFESGELHGKKKRSCRDGMTFRPERDSGRKCHIVEQKGSLLSCAEKERVGNPV